MKLLSKQLIAILFITSITACGGGGGGGTGNSNGSPNTEENDPTLESPDNEVQFVDNIEFNNAEDFIANLFALGTIENEDERNSTFSAYWRRLLEAKRIPYVIGDEVIFLYRHTTATSVAVSGDWNWFTGLTHAQSNASSEINLEKIDGTNLWFAIEQFASDARLDYKYVVNSKYFLDPANDSVQLGGYGDNSFFAMPTYEANIYKQTRENSINGSLSSEHTITSSSLGYNIKYSVYTPYGYTNLSNLPTVYFTDGYLYSDANMGAAITSLNNLIADQMIPPVIAVFVDSSNASTAESKRVEQYTETPDTTASFIVNELVPIIDAGYKTSTTNTDRSIIGVSDGGAFATYMCFVENSVFANCGAQSPEVLHSETTALIESSDVFLDVDIAVTTGNIGDVVTSAQNYRDTLELNGYSLYYQESSQGHSWGNWSDSLPDILQQLLND